MHVKLLQGDSLEVLKKATPNSIDTIITDPPYGLSFMGKKWDYDVPSVELWEQCLRVLKPGGTALIFAGSRTQHRMTVNVEDAGFIIKDTIMWLYGSGFPKATDISKQLDKGVERKVTGVAGKSGSERSAMAGDFKGGEYMSTEPATPEAKLWNGWKSHGLKPAYEPIIVAMKPNDGTYANNALKHGVSGLNIDGGRIGTEESLARPISKREEASSVNSYNWSKYKNPQAGQTIDNSNGGRFPANIILDEEAGKMLDEQSGVSQTTTKKKGQYDSRSGFGGGQINIRHNDKGGASRFFYCAKASKKERGGDNNHPTVKPLKLMEYLCTLTKTPTGGVVLDPFMGSGTTGVACRNTERDFIGIELDPEYYAIAEARVNMV